MITRHFRIALYGHGDKDDKAITQESISKLLYDHFGESLVDVNELTTIEEING